MERVAFASDGEIKDFGGEVIVAAIGRAVEMIA
jgi:hypothetical protein